MNTDVRDMATWTDDLLADIKGGRSTYGLNGHIHTIFRFSHYLLDGIGGARVDDIGGSPFFRQFQAIGIEVDHVDLRRGIELRSEQSGHADRSGPHYRNGVAWFHIAIDHAHLMPSGQDVT